jgi:hypothetical protein
VNVITKRFHPIAKLDRLNFRFERGATGAVQLPRTNPTIIIAVDVREQAHERGVQHSES